MSAMMEESPSRMTTRHQSSKGDASKTLSTGKSAPQSSSLFAALVQRSMKITVSYWFVLPLVLLVELGLCYVIIKKVAYTEIDWTTYMQFSYLFNKENVLDYSLFNGDTGPVAYPAGFLYIFAGLARFLSNNTPDGSSNILHAQWTFAIFHCAVIAAVGFVYQRSKVSAVALWALLLSKRIHSIFVLRMFNDGVAMLFAYIGIGLLLNGNTRMSIFFLLGVALSVKMNILLFLPAFSLIVCRKVGLFRMLAMYFATGLIHLSVAWPFIATNASAYFSRAFNFSREFLYVWSVNWRFLSEETFLKRAPMVLLAGHVATLALWCHFRWLKHDGGLMGFAKKILRLRHDPKAFKPWTPSEMAIMLFECNLIGIIFARSLHYQFYSWYFHSIPLLLFTANEAPFWFKLMLFGMIEFCWNKFPATASTSMSLLVMNVSMLMLERPAPGSAATKQASIDHSTKKNH